MYPDFLTCGKCADEFPLAKIDDFIIHKTSCLQSVWGGDTVSSQAMLSCFLCHQEFHTARGVLHHIQHIHQMDTTQQKTPLSNHPFLSLDKQSIPLSSVAVNHSRTEKRTEPDVLTTVASPKTIATVTQVPNTLELPVTCTKYTTTEGLINNYSGKNCQVTIQPPSTIPPPKKCCSSVVPKKRTRHMQEHDCDDMEQSALETLASFQGYLLKQKIKAHQQKSSCLLSRCPHKCKSKCVREVWHSENRCGSQDKKAKKDCSKDYLNREKENQICHYEPEPDCKTQLMTVETETCNSEEQHTANTKTRIRNSDVNLTIQPTETERAMVRCEDQIPAVAKELNSQWQMLSGLDGSSEQILTGWMYHAELPCFDQTVSVETASNSLSFLADACMMSPLRESSEPDSILDKGKTQRGCKKRHYPTSRPHKCSQCDQAFNQPIHLKKHMSKHTGVKPYKCEQCDYSTVERSHLKAHNRIHTGEKPFQCRFCTYATAQNSTLKVHLKRHHKDKRLVSLETTLSTNH